MTKRKPNKQVLSSKLERLKKLKSKVIETQKTMLAYKQANKIEYFDTEPNPGPNPKQSLMLDAFLDPNFKTFGMSGGNRLGKTTLLTIIGISMMLGEFPWNKESLMHLFPHKMPRKVRYIGQGWNDHIKAVVIPELEKWWPQNRKVERRGNGVITDTFWKDKKTGSTLEIMSNNQRTKEHEGWNGDLILYDEPCRREIYVANARGLVDRHGREMFAATLLDEPWIDREIVKKVDKNGKPDKSVHWVNGTSYDNVGFGISQEGVEAFSEKLSESEREARIHGIPQYMSGLVYPQFKRSTHVKERFDIPTDWMVDIGIDVHPRKKQAILFVATSPRNDKYICDEIWDHGDGDWIADEIIRKIMRNSYRVNKIIIDPLAKSDSNNDNTVFQKIANKLIAYEYLLETASKDKDSGILLGKDHLKGPNNEPSLFLLDNCVRTLKEIEGYMWDKDSKPSKEDDDMMENLYRILLLDTKYVTMQEEMYWNHNENTQSENRNETTGY